jgi:hypothetical protein
VAAGTKALRKPVPPSKFKTFLFEQFQLHRYFHQPGDGRPQPSLPPAVLLWALVIGTVLRKNSHHGIEALAHSPARSSLKISRKFGNDALAYFTERLDPAPLRQALAGVLRQAKRNKAFDRSFWIGLILDGTGVARCTRRACPHCLPVKNKDQEVSSYHHKFSLGCVTAGGLVLPLDVEPQPPGQGELTASRRLLRRMVQELGPRFAQYVVWDSLYANAPALHEANDLGLYVATPLKDNLPTLYAQAQARFENTPAHRVFEKKKTRVELWDADDFDPWDQLRWVSVRVLRYRVQYPSGEVGEGYWLTDIPISRLSSPSLYHLCQGRWGIENHGFNDAKNRYGLEHITHHHDNSLLIHWLLICLALAAERLFRLRYLHRGSHTPMTPAELHLLLWIGLGRPPPDSS